MPDIAQELIAEPLDKSQVRGGVFGRIATDVWQGRWGAFFKERVLPILGLSIAVTVSVMVIVNRSWLASLSTFGYPSIFLASMAWNSTVLFAFPMGWIYFTLGTIFPPIPLALAAGAGAAVGELTSYVIGRSGRTLFNGRKGRLYDRVEKWINKRGLIVIFALNLQPFIPFDLVGLAAGAAKFPVWKYYLATMAGRSLAYAFIAFMGSQGWVPNLPFLHLPA